MYVDNKIKIEHSDWFEQYKNINKGSIDLILTDPPYGKLDKMAWDKRINLRVLEDTFDYVLSSTGLLIMFCDLSLMFKVFNTFSKFIRRSYHIWYKSSAMPISQVMPLPNAEFILVFKRINAKTTDTTWNPFSGQLGGKPYTKRSNILESPTRRHIKNPISTNSNGNRWIKTVIPAPNKPNMSRSERSNHPTQKSESLLRELIRVYSKENDMILDPFSGSGSTLISAKKEKRNSIGFEIEQEYYVEAVERIKHAIDQVELF